MKYGTVYKQGEIIIVPFPFSDLRGIKQRPVLILSKNQDNIESEDIITCGITSNLKNSKYSILIDNSNLVAGSIPIKSRIKVNKIFTINKSIIKKNIAKIDELSLKKIREEFSKLT